MDATATTGAFLTVRELADYLRVSSSKAYDLVGSGEIPAVRVGGQYRIPKVALARHLAQTMKTPEMRGAGLTGPKPLADIDKDADGNLTPA